MTGPEGLLVMQLQKCSIARRIGPGDCLRHTEQCCELYIRRITCSVTCMGLGLGRLWPITRPRTSLRWTIDRSAPYHITVAAFSQRK